MIVKILSSSSSFNGVSYNTNKTDRATGELMKVSGFGYLQDAQNVQKEDYKNYLKAWSAANTVVKDKQFHATISCKGKEFDKFELTRIADRYLHEMGYANNPYLVVFHNDTDNNHVHIVSSRIGKDMKKINDSFEKRRSIEIINKILQVSPQKEASKHLNNALSYNFSTQNQFKLILEQQGYRIESKEGVLLLRKNDSVQGSINAAEIADRINNVSKNKSRGDQLAQIFQKYRNVHDPTPQVVYQPTKYGEATKPIGYRSDLADFLQAKFGVQLIYHGKGSKTPYGYTVIDHIRKNVFKGGDVFPLKDLLAGKACPRQEAKTILANSYADAGIAQKLFPDREIEVDRLAATTKEDLQVSLTSAAHEFGSMKEGLKEFGLEAYRYQGKIYLLNKESGAFINSSELWSEKEQHIFSLADQPIEHNSTIDMLSGVRLQIADDIDDEQINGRNRKRHKRTRTNTH